MSEKYNLRNSLNQDSKLEVVLKREEAAGYEAEIDLLNIVGFMNKRRRIYAWGLVCAMLIGFIVPYMIAVLSHEDTIYTAVLSYDYEGAIDLLAPDGTALDTSEIKSSYVVQEALDKTRLSKQLSFNSLINNMSVSRMLSEETKQQLEVLEKINDIATINDLSKYSDAVSGVNYQYKPQYIITLQNGFGAEKGSKIYLSDSEMKELLSNILDVYKEYFFETYASFKLPADRINDINTDELDYIEWLDNINLILDDLYAYCDNPSNGSLLQYHSTKNGLTLKDLGEMVKLIKAVDVDYIYSYVYCDRLVKNKDKMITKNEYMLRNYRRELDIINENIKTNEAIIADYKNNNILINRTSQSIPDAAKEEPITASTVSDYYNGLVLKQADNYSQKAYYEKLIADVQDKVNGISNKYVPPAKLASLDEEIAEVNTAVRELYSLIKNHAEEILASESYSNSYITCINAQGQKIGTFSADNIKHIVIGVVAGAAFVMVIWFFEGLTAELKRGRNREAI